MNFSFLIPRGCGQIILTKEVWRQKERKQESVRRFCQSTWQVEDSLSNVGKNVQPRFAFCIVFGLFSIEPYRSFCKEYKVCRLCFLSSAKILESNKPCRWTLTKVESRLSCPLLENLFKDAFLLQTTKISVNTVPITELRGQGAP